MSFNIAGHRVYLEPNSTLRPNQLNYPVISNYNEPYLNLNNNNRNENGIPYLEGDEVYQILSTYLRSDPTNRIWIRQKLGGAAGLRRLFNMLRVNRIANLGAAASTIQRRYRQRLASRIAVPQVIQTMAPSRNTNTGRKNTKQRTIWRGPRGGLYVLVNGRKTYKFTVATN